MFDMNTVESKGKGGKLSGTDKPSGKGRDNNTPSNY